MDKIDIRDLILRELKSNEFGTTDQTGNELRVVEDCDFVEIAERIVKNLPIYVVMQQSELLVAFAEWILSSEEDITSEMIKKDVKTFLATNCT